MKFTLEPGTETVTVTADPGDLASYDVTVLSSEYKFHLETSAEQSPFPVTGLRSSTHYDITVGSTDYKATTATFLTLAAGIAPFFVFSIILIC